VPNITESATKLQFDVKTVVLLVTNAVMIAIAFTNLQGQVTAGTTEVAKITQKLDDLANVRERALVLETKWQTIDGRLARIEEALTNMISRRAELDVPPSPARTTRR
jgi:sulfite exporter TauE/SafE